MQNGAMAMLEPVVDDGDKRRSILIIDDDHDQADVLSRRLGSQGFETIVAHSGRNGMAIAKDRSPHLVLLDVRLPDVDGFVVCEELADDPDTCAIPVIMLSGMERPDIIRRSRAVGSQFYVRKPYDPNALLVLIDSAIREAEGW